MAPEAGGKNKVILVPMRANATTHSVRKTIHENSKTVHHRGRNKNINDF